MKKLLTTTVFLCICSFSSHAQGNLVNQSIQQAKNLGERFEVASAFSLVSSRNASQNSRIQNQFINSQEVYVLHYNPSATRSFSTSITFQIPLGNRTMQLELQEVVMDYVVETSCGQTLKPNKNVRHYQGVVKGDPNIPLARTCCPCRHFGRLSASVA